jgi:hypothetical protein
MNQHLVNIPQPSKLLAHQVDYIVVDGSGSMAAKWPSTLRAIQAFVTTLSGHPIDTQVILSTFSDHHLSNIHRDCLIKDWPSLIHNPIQIAYGSTPLYDAINNLGRNMKVLDPPRASVIVFTDGEENSSRFTTVEQARQILDWCRAKGWQVTFFGCDFNNEQQARLLGVNESNAVGVQQALLTDAAVNLAQKRAKYGLYGTEMNFTSDEKSQFGGYLAPPAKD